MSQPVTVEPVASGQSSGALNTPPGATFPTVRLRRLRSSPGLRRMVRETRLSVDDLIAPLFVDATTTESTPVESMPGVARWPLTEVAREAGELAALGIPAVLLFGIPASKDERGSAASAADGIVQRAIGAIKQAHPQLVLIADVCLCEYTSHGHCGVLTGSTVDNDASLELLAETAVSLARAGADVVAPSDMMDGRVGAIRQALDREGFTDRLVMAYSAKFASAFYGPFRTAADSTPRVGDRRAYQMDPPNAREALREIALDIQEGADLVMVKPALAYLDVLARARATIDAPLVGYNVSGEYSMVKAAVANGWLDERGAVAEILTGIKRAGADLIITYHAKDAAQWLREGSM